MTVQSYLLSLLNGLEMPYNVPAAKAYITPPDPRVQAKIPAIYIWPSDGTENRSAGARRHHPEEHRARTRRRGLRA